MQAQAQPARRSGLTSSSGATNLIAVMAAMHVILHIFWYAVPSFVDTDDVGPEQYVVITATLVLGLVALGAMWKGMRWGWWMMVVVTAINVFLTLPEVFMLEGVMRVISILGMAIFLATLVILFRPEVRAGGR